MARPTLPAVGSANWGPTLSAAIENVSDRVDAIATTSKRYKSWKTDFVPGFNTHRTAGGDNAVLPTASASAIQAAIQTGQNFCDLDARYNADGDPNKGAQLWLLHDGEMEKYSDDLSGDVKKHSTATMRAAQMSGSRIVGGTIVDEPFMTLSEAVVRYGDRMLFEVELKNQTSAADWGLAVTLFEQRLKELGNGAINNVVAVMSLPNARDAAHLAVMDAHPDVLWGVYASGSDVGFNDQATYQTLKDHGCVLVGASLSTSNALITWLNQNFICVSGYADRRSQWAAAQAKGLTSMGGEYAFYTSGKNQVLRRDQARDGKPPLGLIPADNHTRPTLMRDGLLFNTPYGGQQWALYGDFAPIPTTCVIDYEFTIVKLGDAPWVGGIGFCQQTDGSYASGGSSANEFTGYFAFLGLNGAGKPYLYEGNGTTFNKLGDSGVNQAFVGTAGVDGRIKITINSSGVRVANCDPVTGAEYSNFYQSTSTTWRGGFISVGGQIGTTGIMKFRRLTIT